MHIFGFWIYLKRNGGEELYHYSIEYFIEQILKHVRKQSYSSVICILLRIIQIERMNRKMGLLNLFKGKKKDTDFC